MQRAVEKQQATGVWVGMEPTNYCWKQLGYDLEQPALPFRLVNALTDTRRPPVSFIAALSYGFRFGVGDLETDVCVGTGGGETL